MVHVGGFNRAGQRERHLSELVGGHFCWWPLHAHAMLATDMGNGDLPGRWHWDRWYLAATSFFLLLVGIVIVLLAPQNEPTEMAKGAFAFVFLPSSFLLATASAILVGCRWRRWTRTDRIIGTTPLALFTLLFLVQLVLSLFFPQRAHEQAHLGYIPMIW